MSRKVQPQIESGIVHLSKDLNYIASLISKSSAFATKFEQIEDGTMTIYYPNGCIVVDTTGIDLYLNGKKVEHTGWKESKVRSMLFALVPNLKYDYLTERFFIEK